MKLSSQEEYGLRCILSLARLESENRLQDAKETRSSLTIAQIAENEGISAEYVGKLLGILGREGLVESVRGRNGGYRLARPADAINVSEALAALGDKFYQSETCDRFAGDHSLCVHSTACSIRSLWSGLQLLLDHVLKQTTLQDLIRIGERNIAEWMKSHLEAVSDLAPLREHLGADDKLVGSQALPFNVVIRSEERN